MHSQSALKVFIVAVASPLLPPEALFEMRIRHAMMGAALPAKQKKGPRQNRQGPFYVYLFGHAFYGQRSRKKRASRGEPSRKLLCRVHDKKLFIKLFKSLAPGRAAGGTCSISIL